jgi:hypothetical protein
MRAGRILNILRTCLALPEVPGIVLVGIRMKMPAERDIREVCATTADVMAAVESLSAEQYHRLKKFARYRIRGLGRAAMGANYISLLDEAVASTLEGADGRNKGRKWAKDRVPFVDHLFGAMRSISSHWKEAYERRGLEAEQLDCELMREDESGNPIRPIEHVADPAADPYRSCAAKDLLDALDKHFAGDEDALIVIEGRIDGMTVPEMVVGLGLPEKKVKAALQRIRYFMEGLV